jgi:hypothetical protein
MVASYLEPSTHRNSSVGREITREPGAQDNRKNNLKAVDFMITDCVNENLYISRNAVISIGKHDDLHYVNSSLYFSVSNYEFRLIQVTDTISRLRYMVNFSVYELQLSIWFKAVAWTNNVRTFFVPHS